MRHQLEPWTDPGTPQPHNAHNPTTTKPTARNALSTTWRGSYAGVCAVMKVTAHMVALQERMAGPRYDCYGPWPVCPADIVRVFDELPTASHAHESPCLSWLSYASHASQPERSIRYSIQTTGYSVPGLYVCLYAACLVELLSQWQCREFSLHTISGGSGTQREARARGARTVRVSR